MSEKLTEMERRLLSSLLTGPKVVDMGRSPVTVITMAWDFAERGLVRLAGSGEISLSEEGRLALQGADHV